MGTTTTRSQKRGRIFYGWWVVAAAFFALGMESGVNF